MYDTAGAEASPRRRIHNFQPDHVREMIRAGADGTIVGSAFVKIIAENSRNMLRSLKKLEGLVRAMKKATIKAK